jgi:hypothetical protein
MKGNLFMYFGSVFSLEAKASLSCPKEGHNYRWLGELVKYYLPILLMECLVD